MKEILETITEWMTHQDDSVMGDYIAHKQLALRLEPPINEEVDRRIAERMSGAWEYCPYCGVEWETDSDAFGCWCCGNGRSLLTSSEKPNNTKGGKG